MRTSGSEFNFIYFMYLNDEDDSELSEEASKDVNYVKKGMQNKFLIATKAEAKG